MINILFINIKKRFLGLVRIYTIIEFYVLMSSTTSRLSGKAIIRKREIKKYEQNDYEYER